MPNYLIGRAIAQAVNRWLPTAAAGFEPGSGQVLAWGDYKEYCLLGCKAAWHGTSLLTFRRNMSSSKLRLTFKRLHDVIYKRVGLFITTSVRI
jgi:hypothetical protein